MRRVNRPIVGLLVVGFVLGGAVVTALVGARPAAGHGSTEEPASRVFACRFDSPDNLMCAAAWSTNAQALYDWMEVNIGDAAGRHRELIPDGRLCSAGRDKYGAFDRPGPWPVTALQADGSGLVDLVYHSTAPHATEYYRVYVTRPGFDARTDTLAWGDLELVHDSGPLAAVSEHRLRAALPDREVPAILYIVWQRSDSPEAFYACSDVTIGGGSTRPAPPTAPTDAPPTTSTPSTTSTMAPPGPSPTTAPVMSTGSTSPSTASTESTSVPGTVTTTGPAPTIPTSAVASATSRTIAHSAAAAGPASSTSSTRLAIGPASAVTPETVADRPTAPTLPTRSAEVSILAPAEGGGGSEARPASSIGPPSAEAAEATIVAGTAAESRSGGSGWAWAWGLVAAAAVGALVGAVGTLVRMAADGPGHAARTLASIGWAPARPSGGP